MRLITSAVEKEKTEIGQSVAFLGILGSSPSGGNGVTLPVRLRGAKAAKWAALIELVVNEGCASPQCLDGLVGELNFPHTSTFGEFARSQMGVLYKNFIGNSTWHLYLVEKNEAPK